LISGSLKRRTPARGKRDSVYTLLFGNGLCGGFFIQTKHKRIPATILNDENSHVLILKDNKRPGERAMLAYLEWAIGKGYLSSGDLLLMDNEASFKTEDVRNFLDHHGIEYDHFPPYRGSIMNPCDNSFHHVLKQNYYAMIRDKTKQTVSEKLTQIHNAYFAIEEKSIQNMFCHVGLLDGDIRPIVTKLNNEGRCSMVKDNASYEQQIKAFLEFARQTRYEFDNDDEHQTLVTKYPKYKYCRQSSK
jgi:hypothetical protein